MSDDDGYRKLFVAESRENHENVVRNLLVLEEGSDDEAIAEIFRSAHTLKGMSASMGFHEMEHLCHSMEDVFDLIRNGHTAVEQDLIDVLLAGTDVIEEMLDDIEGGGDCSSISSSHLVADLEKYASETTEESAEVSDASESCESAPDSFKLTITVDKTCAMKDIRALLVLQNLESLGTIVSSTPTKEDLEDGTVPFSGEMEVEFVSDAGMDAVRSAALGTEIASVCFAGEVQPEPDEPDTPAESDTVSVKSSGLSPAATVTKVERTEKSEKVREVKNLRVDITRLDQMMNLVEDLVINGGRLKQIAGMYKIKEMDESLSMVSRSVSDLQNLMMNIRMIPLNQIFNRFPRVVRDVAHHDGKEVEFTMLGGDTELDRSVMDGLSDPLLHLIRNGVNHGLETPDEREASGKPRKGTLTLSAWREQGNVIIELSEDGKGINRNQILKKAIERGLVQEEGAATLTDQEVIDFLFQPGFSTAEEITDISGRGVGLDVVKSTIESLNGSIKVQTELGKGSRFTLTLPPTMAIVDVMMVRINDRRCAIPINGVVEVAKANLDNIHKVGTSEVIMLRDEVLQIFRLNEMFGERPVSEIMVVVLYKGNKCCIPVDVVEGQQEVVVKPVSSVIGNCRGVGGITIPGDGAVVPVLDVNTMV
ncbi:MAG: chemotaxis protein CheA [Methanomicrobiaceae archaeon]|nr:chemotaxis protein CheA [Methanomicrobiaceae archaeon]